MFIGKYDKSVIVTYLGIVSTMIGIYLVLGNSTPNVTGAIICLMISGICDMFDGKVARMCKNRTEEDKQYGIQIDSLTDMISFIAYPIIILYGIVNTFDVGLCSYIAIPVLSLFTICGISRLAFFNVNATLEDGPVKYYTGLPVTSTAIVFPTVYLLRYVFSNKIFVSIYLTIFALLSFLMIFKFKIKKPKTNSWYVGCSILAFIMAIILILLKVMY